MIKKTKAKIPETIGAVTHTHTHKIITKLQTV